MRFPRMTTRRWMVVVMVAAILCVAAVRTIDRAQRVHRAAQARLATTRQTYARYESLFKGGEVGAMHVHRWSCRVLDAERDANDTHAGRLAALQDHLKRMNSITLYYQSLPGNVCLTAETRLEAADYILEAECWLEKER